MIGGLPTHTDMTWMFDIGLEAQAAKKAKGLTAFILWIIIEAATVQIEETTVNLKEVMVMLKSHVPHGSSLQDPKHLSRRSFTHQGCESAALGRGRCRRARGRQDQWGRHARSRPERCCWG